MTLIREEHPKPGSFDYLLTEPLPPTRFDVPVAGRPGFWKRAAPWPTGDAPPPPPREPERLPRIHVQIEITETRSKPQQTAAGTGYVTFIVIATLILGMLLFSRAHAQPAQWQSYRQGFTTFTQGNDAVGRSWSAQRTKQGFTTYTDMQGPNGFTTHCREWDQGFQHMTECD